jgi:hypothetical protein
MARAAADWLRAGADGQPRWRLQRKAWFTWGHLHFVSFRNGPLAAMQPTKDRQRGRTVDERGTPSILDHEFFHCGQGA